MKFFLEVIDKLFLRLGLKSCSRSFANQQVIKELMVTFRADEYGHEANIDKADLGYGWVHYGLLRYLKPKRILCVGSRHGYIPAILAQACKDNGFGHVEFVDAGYGVNDDHSWTGMGFWKTDLGLNAFRNFNLHNFISIFVLTTDKFAKRYSQNKYDYIYIDGDHSYEGVSFDYQLFWLMLKDDGFMVFHDINVKEEKPEGAYGVWKLWEKLAKTNQTIEFPFSGSGLGLIQKKFAKNKKSN